MTSDSNVSGFRFPPRGDAAERSEDRSRSNLDLGDFVIVLLAGTLADLRDRLVTDGFPDAAVVAADLVDMADAYIEARES